LRQRVLISAAAGLLSLVLMVVLVRPLGVAGLCLGVLAGRLVQTLSYPPLVAACLGQRPAFRPAALIRPALASGLLRYGSADLGEGLVVGSWVVSVFGAGASFGLVTCAALYSGLGAGSRRKLVKRLTVLLPARKCGAKL